MSEPYVTLLIICYNKMAYSIFGTVTGAGDVDLSSYATKVDLNAAVTTINETKLDTSGGMVRGPITLLDIHILNALNIRKTDTASMIARFGTGPDDPRINFHEDLLMNGKYIAGVHDPGSAQDVATKAYVDRMCDRPMKIPCGYIPPLSANVNETRFVASASSEFSDQYIAANAFNGRYVGRLGNGGEWCVKGRPSTFWINIQCPDEVRLWKTSLRGRDLSDRVITNWRLEGSNNNTQWNLLFDGANHHLTDVCRDFPIVTQNSYSMYKTTCLASTGEDPGLSHWQLYVYTN